MCRIQGAHQHRPDRSWSRDIALGGPPMRARSTAIFGGIVEWKMDS